MLWSVFSVRSSLTCQLPELLVQRRKRPASDVWISCPRSGAQIISPDNGHKTLNNRAWINEDLHLRFDKKVHGKQISKRISIPRTTLQSLFWRFARSGLNWPVPGHISPEQLERLLYPGKSQQYEPVPTREIPEKRRRPNFSAELKLHLVELSM